jgi:GNAT superfamily N-acetyltransferase/acyl carrier protein
MTRTDAEQAVIGILRRTALSGSDRLVALDQPLGELGLDSLAMVSFLTALERDFGVALEDVIWVERGRLTLGYVVDLVCRGRPGAVAPEGAPAALPGRPVRSAASESGSADGYEPRTSEFDPRQRLPPLRRLRRIVIGRIRFCLLRCELTERLPECAASIDLQIREIAGDDPRLNVPWVSGRHERELWTREGHMCLTAWHGSELAGAVWLSTTGTTSDSPIRIRTAPGSCYGFLLDENPSLRGHGVGLVLLAHSLRDAYRRGFRRQWTLVDAKNRKMLLVVTQMFGFEKLGEIDQYRLLGRYFVRWRIPDTYRINGVFTA